MLYNKISGANSMYMFELNNKKYYLFGDKHYARRENDCETDIKCDDFDYSYNHIHFQNTGCISIEDPPLAVLVPYSIFGFCIIIIMV